MLHVSHIVCHTLFAVRKRSFRRAGVILQKFHKVGTKGEGVIPTWKTAFLRTRMCSETACGPAFYIIFFYFFFVLRAVTSSIQFVSALTLLSVNAPVTFYFRASLGLSWLEKLLSVS